MPTYAYRCSACEHEFDELQNFSEPPLKKCPACKKAKLVRQFGTGAALLFKGSGFYETDYRSDSYKTAAKADQEASGKSSGTASTDSSATETKTESAKAAPKEAGKSKSKK